MFMLVLNWYNKNNFKSNIAISSYVIAKSRFSAFDVFYLFNTFLCQVE